MLCPHNHPVNAATNQLNGPMPYATLSLQRRLELRRAHDVGGTPGFGPIAIEKDEPVFHEQWEGRVFGMMTTIGHRTFPMRPAIESIEPATYLASRYYEKWLIALEKGLVQSSTFTADELRDRVEMHRNHPDAPVSQNHDSELARSAWQRRYSQRSPKYDGEPAFSVGDEVLTRHVDPSGHTRIPHYAQGKHGAVHALRGVYDLLDLKVQGVLKPEPVYTVGFDARELWATKPNLPSESTLTSGRVTCSYRSNLPKCPKLERLESRIHTAQCAGELPTGGLHEICRITTMTTNTTSSTIQRTPRSAQRP